jgi:curli biogenesis system outer membrane secretion channel CsgG
MKPFLLICAVILLTFAPVEAALIEKGASVAVMDLGVHQGTSDPDINLLNAEKASSEYVIQQLAATNNFEVKDRTLILNVLQKFDMLGLIDPDTAKKIGEIIGVRYIVYGNVVDVSVAVGKVGVTVNTVKAHLVIRIMDVETGNVLMAAKGEGKSASAFIGDGTEEFFVIGTTKVTQTAVHNALQKAAFQAVDTLNERLFSKNK